MYAVDHLRERVDGGQDTIQICAAHLFRKGTSGYKLYGCVKAAFDQAPYVRVRLKGQGLLSILVPV